MALTIIDPSLQAGHMASINFQITLAIASVISKFMLAMSFLSPPTERSEWRR